MKSALVQLQGIASAEFLQKHGLKGASGNKLAKFKRADFEAVSILLIVSACWWLHSQLSMTYLNIWLLLAQVIKEFQATADMDDLKEFIDSL
eukprot:SAG31_NODE_3975_length_3702_cov_42.904246_5_plen_92_part_00